MAKSEAWRNRIVGYGEEAPDQLLGNDRNWRGHTHQQELALQGVLNEVGFVQTIIVNKRTSAEWPDGERNVETLVDGHLRAQMAISHGDKAIPVTYVDLTPAEEREVLLTFDPISGMAFADKEKLDQLLREVQSGEAAVTQMLSDLAEKSGLHYGDPLMEAPEPQIDKAAELQEKWQTSLGQLWQVGEHRILCGDSTKAEDVQRVMGGEKAGGLIADPPYGMRLDADFSGMVNELGFAHDKGLTHGHRYENVIGDDKDFDAAPVIAAFGDPAAQFWFGADYYATTLPDTEHSGAWLVWDKRLDETSDKMFGSCFEMIWSRRKCKRDILRVKWAGLFGTEQEPQRGRVHPNQKPVALIDKLVERIEGIVVDPFLGSGTTLVACERLHRKGRGIEISPAYVAVCLERLSMMGLTPTLVQ